jgi:ribose 1,5-bisphosphokinase PhnN
MRPRRRLKRPVGSAGKGSVRAVALRATPAVREGRVSERGRTTSQAVAKRRARSLKRETGGGAPATQTRSGSGVQGQRKAIRGNRTRERHT